MKYDVIILEPAEQDLTDIFSYLYYDLCESKTAARIYKLLREKINSLSSMPQRCRIVPLAPYAQAGVRRLFVEGYVIFFLIDEQRARVEILRILHHRRQWQEILGDMYIN